MTNDRHLTTDNQPPAHRRRAPQVSVLLPTYNRAEYLGAAIQSALDQTFDDFELIIVDDGSTDNSAAVVSQFTDLRIRLLQQPNRGISAAQNAALAVARGRYITILNSDDRWLPALLATLVPTLDADATVGVAYSRAQAMSAAGLTLPRTSGAPPKFPDDMLASLLYGDHICNIAACFRRDLVMRAGGWDAELIAHEDWDLWLRLAQTSRFVFVDRVLAQFRVHAGRISGSASPRVQRLLDDRIRVVDKAYQQPDLPPHIQQMRSLVYANLYTDIGLRWLSAGNRRAALRFFAYATHCAPKPARALLRIAARIAYQRLLSQSALGVRLVNVAVRRGR